MIAAVAADDEVVSFDISILLDAPKALLESAQEVVRSARFAKRGDPGAVRETLQQLQADDTKRKGSRQPPRGAVPEPGRAIKSAIGPAANFGTPVLVDNTGRGEIEVAASANGNNVVIATSTLSQGGLSFSTNKAVSFTHGLPGIFGLNDPSLARGVSGNFYLAVSAEPDGTPAELNVTGCTNAVSRSTNGGASFALQGYSALCPLTGMGVCSPDQEHIAADAVNAAASNDQLYAVWRNFESSTAATCRAGGLTFNTSSISCSQDNGVNWRARAPILGAGDFPRVAVGRDGASYVVTLTRNSVILNRFTSCADGLTPEKPVTVAKLSEQVACPVPGLDRCNDGNKLSSPTVAPDPAKAGHLFVSFAEKNGSCKDDSCGERIVTLESTDGGRTFANRQSISDSPLARRFMPWACSTHGSAWTGWYDRTAATTGATNDLTDYFLGSTDGRVFNLSNNPDPQCASGWGTVAPRSADDPDCCSVQPQLAGVCRTATGGGSGTRCEFSATCPASVNPAACPAGETCQTGGGAPKYGDYNGIACGDNFVIAAWSSATSPAGLPPGAGLRVFASALSIQGFAPPNAVIHNFGYEDDAGGWRVEKHLRLLGNVNGIDADGRVRADIVAFGDHFVFVALGQPDNTFSPPKAMLPELSYDAGWRVEKHPRRLGDVDGDGRADIVGFGNDGVFIALGQPDGTFSPPKLVVNDLGYDAGGWRVDKHLRLLGDVNADGRADIVGFDEHAVFTVFGQPDGTFTAVEPVLHDLAYADDAGKWRIEKHPRFLADVNGDRGADIVGFGDHFVFVALSLLQ